MTVEAAILQIRKQYPTWGSKKILAVLHRVGDHADLPARSTIDAVLSRAGVVRPRKAFRRRQPSAAPLVEAHASNDVWSIDYKGWFRVGDGTRCDSLTINDVFSRASLGCRAMVAPKLEDVRHRLEGMFEQYGLPQAMLSDNGPTFGSTGIGRLSRLGVWLLRLGIRPLFIEPGRPDQNGKHERSPRDAEGGDRVAAARDDHCAAGGVHSLPGDLQRGAAARRPRDEGAGGAVRLLAAIDAARVAGARVPDVQRGASRAHRWLDQVGGRVRVRRRGDARRTRGARQATTTVGTFTSVPCDWVCCTSDREPSFRMSRKPPRRVSPMCSDTMQDEVRETRRWKRSSVSPEAGDGHSHALVRGTEL